jgi:hypothetical protein
MKLRGQGYLRGKTSANAPFIMAAIAAVTLSAAATNAASR